MTRRATFNFTRTTSQRLTRPGASLSILTALVALTTNAFAQDPPPAAPPAAASEAPPGDAPAQAPPLDPPSAAPPPAAPVEEAPKEEAPKEEPKAAPGIADEFVKTFTVGVGMRTGLNMGLSGPTQGQLKLDDGLVDQANLRPFMAGNFTKDIGFFTQLELGTVNGLGSFAILDAIAQIKFVDELQLWVGQHIPANDRNNMNGPFFGNGWNFAIAVPSYPFDAGARDRGATVWGLIADGHVKYHASIVDLQPGRDIGQARYAGRVTVHLLEPENFYYNSGSYFGTKDVLAIGGVVQGQSGLAAVANDDFVGFSFDAFFEKNLGEGGTLTLEGGYWNFDNVGAAYVVNQNTIDTGLGVAGPYPGEAVLAMASWLTPNKIGPGQLQPNVRVQYGEYGAKTVVIDGGLAYVLDGFNHKYHLNYRHTDATPATGGTVSSDMIQVGVQYMMSK